MAGQTGSTKLRQQSGNELELVRLTLTEVGGLCASAVEKQSWRAALIADNLFAPQSSVADWLGMGTAAWIEGIQDGVDLVQGLCSALWGSFGDSSDKPSGVHGDQVIFYIDNFSEATDAIETDIPISEIDNVVLQSRSKAVLDDCINLSISSDNKSVLVALFNLTKDGTPRLDTGSYSATLAWGKNAIQKITVNVAATPP